MSKLLAQTIENSDSDSIVCLMTFSAHIYLKFVPRFTELITGFFVIPGFQLSFFPQLIVIVY